jgi:(p)ppGpp synthase/HD superfamily hydrolase
MLTERFARAVDYARIAHAGQVRKGTAIPYVQHLLAVASLVLEHGGDEDQAIAGLLHDVLEDCGQEHAEAIGRHFGTRVLAMVRGCTDGTAQAKAALADAEARRRDWLRRKQTYLAHLADADDDTLLVSGCDKLHNARAIVDDLERPLVGQRVFERFTGGRDGTLTYYRLLADLFSQRGAAMAPALERAVERLHELAGETPCRAW